MVTGTRLATIGALSLPLMSCMKYDFERKAKSSTTEKEVVVAAAEPTPADILFVVDNSGSMADEQENLARNFDAFINQIAGTGNYRIGIITTDVSDSQLPLCAAGQSSNCDPGEKGGLAITTFSPNPPNVFKNQDVAQCMPVNLQHGCFRGASGQEIISSDLPKDQQVQRFKDNVRVGSCGSGQEQGLNSMLLGLGQDRLAGCNTNFLRENANLVIVIVTDENDDDPNVTPINQTVNRLLQIKPAAQTRVAVIAGVQEDGTAGRCRIGDGGGPVACGDICGQQPPAGSHTGNCLGNPGVCGAGEFCDRALDRCENEALQFWEFCHWCSYYNTPSCCSALAGNRYVEFAVAMEQKIVEAVPGLTAANCRAAVGERPACLIDSICQKEFARTLERIAKDLVISTEYNLNPPAVYPEGVSVTIGTRQLKNGVDFQVSADGRQLTLTTGGPGEGEDVTVNYVVAECGDGRCDSNPGGESNQSCAADCP
ncbi:MAG: VWA domain-containing protein [Deltaproteobacteria bacterium]|nr:VWA domain-containing protein [Deltaproteobacteria bacterium]